MPWHAIRLLGVCALFALFVGGSVLAVLEWRVVRELGVLGAALFVTLSLAAGIAFVRIPWRRRDPRPGAP